MTVCGGLVFFCAFEPSGDALAAPVIAALRAARPDLPILALGGARMERAGAVLLERTTDDAVMLAGAATHLARHWARLRRLRRWVQDHPVRMLVPVDSPAANWAVCRLVRRTHPHAPIMHLVAPQLWAWAPWRAAKLRRLTDRLLCVLPFEPAWFAARGIPATFVGHPLFDRPATAPAAEAAATAPGRHLALMPGSRPAEIRANLPTMLAAFGDLRREDAALAGLIAAADEPTARMIMGVAGPAGLPPGLAMRTDDTAAILTWADAVLVKSGTGTLEAAAAGVPMVAVYNVRRWAWHLAGRWLVRTPVFTLPNLIGQHLGLGRIVPELVPNFGEVEPVRRELRTLLNDPAARRRQREDLARIAGAYRDCPFARRASDCMLAALP